MSDAEREPPQDAIVAQPTRPGEAPAPAAPGQGAPEGDASAPAEPDAPLRDLDEFTDAEPENADWPDGTEGGSSRPKAD